MNNICVITSAHPRFDIRIFHKQCKTLVREGYKVSLFVCDGLGDDIVDGVQIHDIGAASSRLHRIFFKTAELYKAVSKKTLMFIISTTLNLHHLLGCYHFKNVKLYSTLTKIISCR